MHGLLIESGLFFDVLFVFCSLFGYVLALFFVFTVFCCVLWVLPFFVYCGMSVDLVFWVL